MITYRQICLIKNQPVSAHVAENIIKYIIWDLWSPYLKNTSSSKSGFKFRLGKIPEYSFTVTL